MATAETRSTVKAGNVQAGDTLRSAQPVGALLAEVGTVADADQLRPILARRLAAAEAAANAHGEPDELAEDAELLAHAEERDRLAREVERCRVALQRLADRRAALVIADQQAAARSRLKAAALKAERAEASVVRYTALARELGELLAGLDQDQREIIAAREEAVRVGIGEEAGALVLPHERRFRPAEFGMVEEAIQTNRAPTVTDAAGHDLGGRGGRHFEPEAPAPAPSRRMVEKLIRPQANAPDLARAAIYLPSPEPDAAPLVARKGG